jgi:hypothetical protein
MMRTAAVDFPPKLRSSFPFDFRLLNPDGNPIILISDNPVEGNRLVLTVTNRSRQPISFFKSSPVLFVLSFRKGILSAKTVQLLKSDSVLHEADKRFFQMINVEENNWDLAINFKSNWEGGRGQSILGVGGHFGLTLNFMTADGTGGERATETLFSPIGLLPGPLQGLQPGIRRQQLCIQNLGGRPQAPLKLSVAGAQTIKNDGVTRNTISLAITNTQAQALQFNPRGNPTPTTLTVAFDTSDTSEKFPLTDSSNAGKIVCDIDAPNWHAIDPTYRQGQAPEFSFMTDSIQLAPKAGINIHLGEIVSKTVANQARLILRYENIPGYPSGTLIVLVDKTT